MKKTILLILTTLVHIVAIAGNMTVSGRILDGTTNQPFDFVNVALYKQGSSEPVTGGFSDADGMFELHAEDGKYTFKATFLGYTTYSKDVASTPVLKHIRIGTVKLTEDAKQIAEVEVIGQGSSMKLDIDKRVFNVDQSIVGDGASAAEILENIPSVDVDTEGNVSLRNSSSVEIWINGKPSGLTDTDKGQILEMLPADAIKSVEVITNPSAKYNPEGNAGIINIVMKEGGQRGYFGSVTAGAIYREGSPYPGGQAGLNFTYNESKWSFNLNSNLRYNRRDRGSHLDRKNFTDLETTYLKQDSKSAFHRLNGFLRAGFNYNITTVDEIGVTAYGMMGGTRNKGNINYTDLDAEQTVTKTRERITGTDGLIAFYDITANYKHSFIKDIHDISASVNYNGQIRNSESRYFTNAYQPDLTPIPDAKVRQRQTLDSKANNASAQIDYMNKVAKDHKIEAGLKADIKFSDSYDHTYDSIFIKNREEEDLSKYNPFNYSEQVYAAYINYAAKFNWFSLQVGLRCEETITNAKSIKDDFHRSYFQPFPSVYLGFDLGKSNTLQLSYTRRINRPRGNRINSFVDRSDPSNLRHGNPWLMPEFGNVVELNYLKDWEMHSLSASLFYNYTENVIQQVSRLITTNVMETTYENITHSQNAGAEIVAKNRLFKNYLDLTTTISAYYYQLGANEQYNIKRTDSFSWNARINANVKIISNLSAQVSAYYSSPRIVAQGTVDQSYGMDLGIKANFLKKKLSISFTVKDVLDSRKKGHTITESTNFHQESYRTSCDRSYRLTLTYNFGDMKSKSKEKKDGDRNDNDDFDDDL